LDDIRRRLADIRVDDLPIGCVGGDGEVKGQERAQGQGQVDRLNGNDELQLEDAAADAAGSVDDVKCYSRRRRLDLAITSTSLALPIENHIPSVATGAQRPVSVQHLSTNTQVGNDDVTSDGQQRSRSDPTLRSSDVTAADWFSLRQLRLQQEAKLALAQAPRMARMQLQVEKRPKKKSPIAQVVGEIVDTTRSRLTDRQLLAMNVAQLQVVTNDLLSQIEELNSDLVQLLLERDELYMQQDAYLVDIDDFTRRGQESTSCYDLRHGASQ
jgi:hypothetical protein